MEAIFALNWTCVQNWSFTWEVKIRSNNSLSSWRISTRKWDAESGIHGFWHVLNQVQRITSIKKHTQFSEAWSLLHLKKMARLFCSDTSQPKHFTFEKKKYAITHSSPCSGLSIWWHFLWKLAVTDVSDLIVKKLFTWHSPLGTIDSHSAATISYSIGAKWGQLVTCSAGSKRKPSKHLPWFVWTSDYRSPRYA